MKEGGGGIGSAGDGSSSSLALAYWFEERESGLKEDSAGVRATQNGSCGGELMYT